MAIKYGFDSRFWNGVLPAGYDHYEFYIAKATESDWFLSSDFAAQYEAGRRYFGDMVGAWHFHRYYSRNGTVASVSTAARKYYDAMQSVGGLGRFPPIVDLEDVWGPPSLRLTNHMNDQVKAVEDVFGEEALIYTANWWWQRHAEPYVQPQHVFYDRKLWESDPAPDTREPGEWTKDDLFMVQTRLDWPAPGFRSTTGQQGTIDENELLRPEWLRGEDTDDPLAEAIDHIQQALTLLEQV